jgi:hypothetical protein
MSVMMHLLSVVMQLLSNLYCGFRLIMAVCLANIIDEFGNNACSDLMSETLSVVRLCDAEMSSIPIISIEISVDLRYLPIC